MATPSSSPPRARKGVYSLPLLSNTQVGDGTYLLVLALPGEVMMPTIEAGQFVQVAVPSGNVYLRRPISVCNVDESRRELWLLVASIGEGTRSIVETREGDRLSVILPLGNGFTLQRQGRLLLVGGGVGIAPMLYLTKRLYGLGNRDLSVLLGGRTSGRIVLQEEFERYAQVYISTDDGSLGYRGRVMSHPVWDSGGWEQIYSCGPKPMMQAVGTWARVHEVPCELSLENMMACGVGACLCCVEDIEERGHVCVCTEGPVFSSSVLKW